MVMYVGETITVVGAAINPLDKTVITDADGEVELYAPGKNPAKVPSDRVADKGPFTMTFNAAIENTDGTTGAYEAFVPTDDTWTAGKWSYKVTLINSYATWEYGTFTLVA